MTNLSQRLLHQYHLKVCHGGKGMRDIDWNGNDVTGLQQLRGAVDVECTGSLQHNEQGWRGCDMRFQTLTLGEGEQMRFLGFLV